MPWTKLWGLKDETQFWPLRAHFLVRTMDMHTAKFTFRRRSEGVVETQQRDA